MSITDICICGAPVLAHMNRHGHKTKSCEQARRAFGYEPVNFAKLLQLALERQTAAHAKALGTVREINGKMFGGAWTARVGGRYKGFRVFGKSKSEVTGLVNAYYHERWKQRRLRRPV